MHQVFSFFSQDSKVAINLVLGRQCFPASKRPRLSYCDPRCTLYSHGHLIVSVMCDSFDSLVKLFFFVICSQLSLLLLLRSVPLLALLVRNHIHGLAKLGPIIRLENIDICLGIWVPNWVESGPPICVGYELNTYFKVK